MIQLDAMHTVLRLRRYWMDTLIRVRQQSAMPGEFHIDKLSDEFGQ
jgi:hypothetical protein